MSQENVEVVRRFYDGLARDLGSAHWTEAHLTELFDPEIHVDQTRRVLNPSSYDGYDGLLRGMGEIQDAWERWCLQPERFVDAGEQVVVVETAHGRGRGSGIEVINEVGTVYTLRRGRIVRMEVYWDPSEALEAVGLRE